MQDILPELASIRIRGNTSFHLPQKHSDSSQNNLVHHERIQKDSSPSSSKPKGVQRELGAVRTKELVSISVYYHSGTGRRLYTHHNGIRIPQLHGGMMTGVTTETCIGQRGYREPLVVQL